MAISIAFIIVTSLLLGSLLGFLGIPPLVGMLALGIFLNLINWIDSSLLAIGTDLRMIALIIILLRAGFELSFDTLKRVGRSAILLSFLPALFEALTITFVGPIFLPLTYLESALLGCVLGAVSPAVVVPMMVGFIEEKRGTKKGIPTLVLAGASMDDVVVIVAFTALLGVYLGEQVNLTYAIASIPISIILGIGVGIGLGLILARLFERYNPRATKRALLILGLAILLVSSEPYLERIHIPFAGFLSVMAIGFIILQKREAMA